MNKMRRCIVNKLLYWESGFSKHIVWDTLLQELARVLDLRVADRVWEISLQEGHWDKKNHQFGNIEGKLKMETTSF